MVGKFPLLIATVMKKGRYLFSGGSNPFPEKKMNDYSEIVIDRNRYNTSAGGN